MFIFNVVNAIFYEVIDLVEDFSYFYLWEKVLIIFIITLFERKGINKK